MIQSRAQKTEESVRLQSGIQMIAGRTVKKHRELAIARFERANSPEKRQIYSREVNAIRRFALRNRTNQVSIYF